MLNHFVCGSFHHQEDMACSSPNKKSKRKESRNNSNNKNPYSNRGLDKFSALLADLDERRQKVYSQMSPQDISIVRFAHSSNDDDFVPIVVKVKNNNNNNNNKDHRKKHNKSDQELIKATHLTSFSEQLEKSAAEERKNKQTTPKKQKNLRFSWNVLMKRPSFYVPVVVIFILVFLVLFGRSVATLCTCVMWYMVPTLSEYYDSSKESTMNSKKIDYVRRWLNDTMNLQDLASPRTGTDPKHGHQKSW